MTTPEAVPPDAAVVETVLGPVPVRDLGVTLVHEHIQVDWIGADRTTPDRYDRDEVVDVARPHLERAREVGVRSLFDCTPAFLGRDVRVLEQLARQTGMHILANTGYYGAADDRYVPAHAYGASAVELATIWIREREEGIDGTGIRPAFMKIGVDPGPLSAIDAKLVEAAAIAHHTTGMSIHSHTGDSEAGFAQLDLLERLDVALERFVWVHAQNVDDIESLVRAAERGAWIELDGVAPDTVARHAELVDGLSRAGLLRRVLVSHDAGAYDVGKPGGAAGSFRGYDTVFTELLPALREGGFGDEELDTLLIANPRDLLTGRRGP